MTGPAADLTAFRLGVSRRETPRALAVTGGFFAAVTVVNAMFGPPLPVSVVLLNAAVAILLLGCASLARTSFVPLAAWPWLAAGCAVAMVGVGQVQVWWKPDGASFAYLLVIMVAYGPLTLAWLPAGIAAVPMLVGSVLLARLWPAGESTDWIIAAVAAVAIGLTLLWLRLRSLGELAQMTARVEAMATRDPLTGLMNRRGLDDRLPELAGLAARRAEPVFAMFVDIDGFKQVNDSFGHHAGDRVLRLVADTLRGAVRAADIVARWGGDEFVVLGLGTSQEPARFSERIRERLRREAAADAEWSGIVSIGTAVSGRDASGPDGLDVDELVRRADEDMYDQRRDRPA